MRATPALRQIDTGGQGAKDYFATKGTHRFELPSADSGNAVLDIKAKVTDHDTDGGSATEVITGSVPDDCAMILAVQLIVLEAVSGTNLTNMNLGDETGDGDLYCSGVGLAVGSDVGSADYTAWPHTHTKGEDLMLTGQGSTPQFDAGKVRATVWYIDAPVPTE